MSKIIAVIGAGYGDEGKGLMTDYFAHSLDEGFVVRHSSSAQAGHTVQLADGTRHIFSHFGSGTLVGWPTVLGERFVVNPLLFRQEFDQLKDKGYTPKVFVHENCMVTTPYDMIINQLLEYSRGDLRHGSCGVGFGETIERHEKQPHLQTLVKDLVDELMLITQVQEVCNQYLDHRKDQLGDMNHPWVNGLMAAYNSTELFVDYINTVKFFLENVTIVSDYSMLEDSNIVFEGAQGLMLDQNSSNFPYVTRSNTGIKNVVEILDTLKTVKELEVVYVSRCYTTKHGAGPLAFEESFPEELEGKDLTNHPNEFQGSLRYAPLDLGAVINHTYLDIINNHRSSYNITRSLAFTWMDYPQKKFLFDGSLTAPENTDPLVTGLTLMARYLSYGPTRDTIITVERSINITND